MKLIEENITQTLDEIYLIETLNLDNKTILELGCGSAFMTKQLALNGSNRKIIAYETNESQHKKNIALNIENIQFKLNDAHDIKLENQSVDMIFMFESFHRIPYNLMKKALEEIKRVLKPNGLVYISESFLKDEQQIKIDAFEHIKQAVESEQFKLFRELFFQSEIECEEQTSFMKPFRVDILQNI